MGGHECPTRSSFFFIFLLFLFCFFFGERISQSMFVASCFLGSEEGKFSFIILCRNGGHCDDDYDDDIVGVMVEMMRMMT